MSSKAAQEAVLEKAISMSLNIVEEKLNKQIQSLESIENMNDDELEQLRQKRRDEMKKNQAKRETLIAKGHGAYSPLSGKNFVSDEKDFFQRVKGSDLVVVHFGRESTERCSLVDAHFAKIAPKYVGTLFLKIDAEKSPFLSERLKIRVLPSIVLIKKGKTEHTIVGFDEFMQQQHVRILKSGKSNAAGYYDDDCDEEDDDVQISKVTASEKFLTEDVEAVLNAHGVLSSI